MILFIGVSAFVLGLWLGAHYASIKLDDLYQDWQSRQIREWLERGEDTL